MPSKDLYHLEVRRSLEKDGWIITHDEFVIQYKGKRLYADLGAEKVFAASKGAQKIVVEIKVFGSPSPITELEKAIGQYSIYRSFLSRTEPERMLYLAIAEDIFQDFISHPAIEIVVEDYHINLIVFDPETEEITQWIQN